MYGKQEREILLENMKGREPWRETNKQKREIRAKQNNNTLLLFLNLDSFEAFITYTNETEHKSCYSPGFWFNFI